MGMDREPPDGVRLEHLNQRPSAAPPPEGNLGPFRRFGRKFTAAADRVGRRPSATVPTDPLGPEYGDSF